MIVIVNQTGDFHARVVASHLERRGARVFIADPRELGVGAELNFCPHAPEQTEWRRRDGAVLRMSEAGAVWFRPKASPVIPPDVDHGGERQFITREWSELVRGMLMAIHVPVINPFYAALDATKPYQLTMALRAGLSVPETIVTSSERRVRDFAAGPGELVHKTMTAPDDRVHATRRLDDVDASALGELELAPTIFQRRVAGTRELRITVVGERLFAAEFRTELVDGRLDHAVAHSRHDLPVSVARALLALLEKLALPYAAVDMRIDGRGEYQFLEVNPAGQFLWIEIRTGMPIAAAVADLLLTAAGNPRSVPPSDRPLDWRSRPC